MDLSCPDWWERMKAGQRPFRQPPAVSREGERAVAVFKKLRLADVPGTPTLAEAGGEWFFDIVRALWGSLDPVTRQRAIRELFLLVPKKNSKTTNGALLMLTALLLNQRPHASLIMTAPVQDVAQLAFDAAAGAVALDPVLSKKLHVREHLKTIVHRETKAELQIMTFDPSVLTGQKPVAALIDELHVVAKMSKAASALRQLRGGMLPYPEAFMAFITTQSEEAPAGVFRAELLKARAIRDGKQEGAMLPVLYEFPEELQKDTSKAWKNPVHWHMVTPNAGRSITVERLVEEMKTAEATSEEELRAWASQHLNVEIGLALHSDRWSGADFWERQADDTITLDAMFQRCSVLVVAVDGGGHDDLYGVTLLGREKGSGDLLSWSHAYALPIVLERRKDIAPRLLDFQRDGDLTIVPKIEEACAAVVALVQRADNAGLLGSLHEGKKRAIGVDAACIKQTLDALNAAGYPDEQIVGVSQGWRLTTAIKSTELYLSSEALRHAPQPLMSWCVGNAKVEPKGNAVLITKQASGSAKIDPLMSLFSAVEVMAMSPAAAGRSFWETAA